MATEPTAQAPRRPLLTPREVAEWLGLDKVLRYPEESVRRMVRERKLRGVRVSKCVMIDPASVEKFIAEQP